MTIVLGGSRHIFSLPSEIQNQLQKCVEANEEFFIGDAPGADSAFQNFFRKLKYNNVKIFSSAGTIRNNLGSWESEQVLTGLKNKSNASHAFKDRFMCKKANSGVMLWDCKSAGTLSNIVDLIEQEKNCIVWVEQDSNLLSIQNLESLKSLTNKFPKVYNEALKRLATYRRREQKRKTRDTQPLLFGNAEE